MHCTPSSVAASAALFTDACAVIPGGVNSPVRAFSSVGGTPRFITSAAGYWLTDADDNRYIDLMCSWGPMILGHAYPAIVQAIVAAAKNGTSYGAPTELEIRFGIVRTLSCSARSLGVASRMTAALWSTVAKR